MWRTLAALLIAGLIALTPSLGEARAGGSYSLGGGGSFSSQGSLGSRTYNFPMNRSLTPAPYAQGYGAPYGGYSTAHPFVTGLFGGLFGSFLGRLLFPGWGMGYGYGGGFLGIFGWIFILWAIWGLYRAFGRGMSFGGPSHGMLYSGLPMMGAGPAQPRYAALAIAGQDYQAFETILKAVQTAWSDANLAELRRHVTPEMLSYFAEELAENESQGVRNHVEQVELLRGDLREAWDEGHLHYATCYLRWRAIDYTVRAGAKQGDPGAIVSGDPSRPTEAAETWTFARSPGGSWLLSAIQQV
jgi:predicted lipid-binding transport protein (Tim44 family)